MIPDQYFVSLAALSSQQAQPKTPRRRKEGRKEGMKEGNGTAADGKILPPYMTPLGVPSRVSGGRDSSRNGTGSGEVSSEGVQLMIDSIYINEPSCDTTVCLSRSGLKDREGASHHRSRSLHPVQRINLYLSSRTPIRDDTMRQQW